MQKEVIEMLKKDPIANLPVMGFFQNYPAEKYFIENNSLIITGTSDYTWAYLAVYSSNDLGMLLAKFNYETLYFANVEEWMIPQLKSNHRIEWKLFTNRYYLPDEVDVGPSDQFTTQLEKSQVKFIFQNSSYKDFTSERYIAERIERDISAAIWVDDNLVGWGLTHDDGSLGFLNVISEHRGKGIGEAVFRTLINAKREKGMPVFVNVEPQNKQSISLLEKLGLVFDRSVSWVKLS